MSEQITRWLDESQQLADQATEGPWAWSAAAHGSPTNGPTHHEVRERGGMVAETDYDLPGAFDAEFIAESRTRFPQAVAALKAVIGLHRPFRDAHGWTPCRECEQPWPCLTVQELDATLGLEGDGDECLAHSLDGREQHEGDDDDDDLG